MEFIMAADPIPYSPTAARIAINLVSTAAFALPGGPVTGAAFQAFGSSLLALNPDAHAAHTLTASDVRQIITDALLASSARQYADAVLSAHNAWREKWYIPEVVEKRPLSPSNDFYAEAAEMLRGTSSLSVAIQGLFDPPIGKYALSSLAMGTGLYVLLAKLLIVHFTRTDKRIPKDRVASLVATVSRYAQDYQRVAQATEQAALADLWKAGKPEGSGSMKPKAGEDASFAATRDRLITRYFHGDARLKDEPVRRFRQIEMDLQGLLQDA
jgi:hypothetical protein